MIYRLSAIGYRLILVILFGITITIGQIALAASDITPTKEEAVEACEAFLRSYEWAKSNRKTSELTANIFQLSNAWLTKRNLDPTKMKVNGRRVEPIELVRYASPKVVFVALSDGVPYAKLTFEVRRENGDIVIVPEKISPENREWIEPYKYEVIREERRASDRDFIDYYSRAQTNKNQNEANGNQDQRSSTKQICEAQKQTCLAGCGNSTYWNGSRYVDNQSWSGCHSRCSSISCN